MAENENIGGVSVTIGGDYSQMLRDFATAQSAAQQAGNVIASSFGSGAAQASGLVDQFGRSIQSAGSAAEAATAPMATLNDVVAQLGSIQNTLAASTTRATQAIREQTAAAHGAVTEIQATSGALRTLEGTGGIRAAERFLTLIPGLGAALQVAFPVIGALALGEAIVRMIGHFNELSEAEKHLAEATRQNDAEWERFSNQIEHTNVERITAELGKLQGLKLQGFYDEGTAQRDRINIQNTQKQIELAIKTFNETKSLYSNNLAVSTLQDFNPAIIGARIGEYFSAGSQNDQIAKLKELQDKKATLEEQVRAFENNQKKNSEDQARTAAEDAGRASAARISNQEQLNQRLAELAKQRVEMAMTSSHAEAQAEIDALVSPQARMIAEAEEELRIAREKQAQLLQIAEVTRDRQIELIRQRANAEGGGKTPTEQSNIQIKAEGEIAAARANYTKEALSLQQAVEAAAGKVTAAIVTGTREETKAEQEYEIELARTNRLWAERTKLADDFITKMEAANAAKPFEPRPDIEQIPIKQTPAQRLAGTPLGQVADLDQLSRQTGIQVQTNEQQEARIRDMQAELNLANQLNVPVAERLSLEQQILQARIALAAANGQSDNADKVALANAQLQQTLQQWKSLGIGNIALDLENAAVKLPAALGNAISAGVFQHGKNTGVGEEVARALKGIGQQLLGQVIQQTIQRLIVTILGNTVAQTVLHVILGTNVGVQAANTAALSTNAVATTVLAGTNAALIPTIVAQIAALDANTTALYVQASLGGFADGGSPPVGVPSIVGERGPELFIPREAGAIIPNHMLNGYADGAGMSQFTIYPNSGGGAVFGDINGDLHFHAHDVQNPRQHAEMAMRVIPQIVKSRSAKFSPYGSS